MISKAYRKWSSCGNLKCPNDELSDLALRNCLVCRMWTPRTVYQETKIIGE